MTAAGSTVRMVGLVNSITPSPCLFGSSRVHRPHTPVAGVWKKTLETKSPLSMDALVGLLCLHKVLVLVDS